MKAAFELESSHVCEKRSNSLLVFIFILVPFLFLLSTFIFFLPFFSFVLQMSPSCASFACPYF